MDNPEFKSAVITVLTALRDEFLNDPKMLDSIEKYAVRRIENAIQSYKNGVITACEALEIGIKPLKQPLAL